MNPVSLIRRVAAEAQAQLDRSFAAGPPPAWSALDQAGLRDGMEIIENYLSHNEMGVALEHLLYMIHEPPLHISTQSRADVTQAARLIGLAHLLRDTDRPDSATDL